MGESTMTLAGLGSLDQAELDAALDGQGVRFQAATVPEGSLPEPATIAAVVTLGSVALATLAAWLAKPRRRFVREHEVTVQHPDGTITRHRLVITATAEEEVKAQVLTQLGAWVKSATGAAGAAG
jgi:hypothetical protein